MWGSCEKKAKKVNVSNLIPESANGTLTMDPLKHYISSIMLLKNKPLLWSQVFLEMRLPVTLHLTYQYFNQFILWVTLVLVSYLITATCTNHGLALTTLMTCSAFSWTGDPLSGEAAKGNKIIVSTIFVTQGTSDNLTCNQAFFFFFTAGRREKECLILILHMLSACSPESGLFADWS